MNDLDKYMLDWWFKYLIPVIDKICEDGIEQKGNPDYWKDFYKLGNTSNGAYIQGWVNVLNPYVVAHGGCVCKN